MAVFAYAPADQSQDTMDSDFEDEPQGTLTKTPRKSAAGRKLVRWNPDVDQYLLLTIEYVCTTKGIAIPYSDVAAVMREELSGEAIKQHLAKLYKIRMNHDRTVPPPHGKQGRRHGKSAKRGASANKIKQSTGKNDVDADSDDETPGKGSSLLWHGPWKSEKKSKPSKLADKSELNTPVPKRGSKGRGQGETGGAGGEQSGEMTKSTGKRSRKKRSPKQAITNEPIDSEGESPSKRKKTYKLRQKKDVSYTEDHADLDADLLVRNDDETFTAPDEDPQSVIKVDRESSQDNMLYGLPPPPFGMPSAFHGHGQMISSPPHPAYSHTHEMDSYSTSYAIHPTMYTDHVPDDHGSFGPPLSPRHFQEYDGLQIVPSTQYSAYEQPSPDEEVADLQRQAIAAAEHNRQSTEMLHTPEKRIADHLETPISEAARKSTSKSRTKNARPEKKSAAKSNSAATQQLMDSTLMEAPPRRAFDDPFVDSSPEMYHSHTPDYGADYETIPYHGFNTVRPRTQHGMEPLLHHNYPSVPHAQYNGGELDFAHGAYHPVSAAYDIHLAEPTVMAAPTSYGGFQPSHNYTAMTPAMSNLSFNGGNVYNTQAIPFASQNSSFASVDSSQSIETATAFDQMAYSQELPSDAEDTMVQDQIFRAGGLHDFHYL